MDFKSLFVPFQNHDLCLWFYFLSVIGFVFLVFAVVTGLYLGITTKKNGAFYLSLLFVSSWYLIFYFQNRLLYTMCVKSV